MSKNIKPIKNKIITAFVTAIFIFSMFTAIPSLQLLNAEIAPPDSYNLDEIMRMLEEQQEGNSNFDLSGDTVYPDDIDLASYLRDYSNDYSQIYQPWKTKAAVRCIEISDDYQYMIVGGGYLYDNEIHIYRWNDLTNQYAKVWNSGDDIIKEDVIDVDIADTDHNQFLEIVAASADGSFHVFEQMHIYDPTANTENMFEHVYSSPYIGQVWGVEINDTDWDYDPDIIVVSWDHKVHVYEYFIHSGYPFAPEHWIEYEEKWVSHNLGQHPTSLVVGDTNANGLPDFVVGTREGGIFIFENNGTLLDIHGQPYPLCQDNSYKLIYSDINSIWRPIYSMEIGDLDGQIGDEVVIASFAFNAYVLRYNQLTETYYLQKLIKDFEPWTLKDFYPADDWADNMTAGQNVYFNDPNAGLGTTVPEPIPMTDPWFVDGNYPYNSGSVQNNDTCWTLFRSSSDEAYAIYDFGADEEGTGNGNDKADFSIVFKTPYSSININDFELSISQDYEHWMAVNSTSITKGYSSEGYASLNIDVDTLLVNNKWDFFQYVNVTVLQGNPDYHIYRLELHYVNVRVDDALSATIGTLASSYYEEDTMMQALIGTVDGRIIAFKYNSTLDEFVLTWDSWVDDRFSMGMNIWDLEQVKTLGTMPMIYGITDLETDYILRSDYLFTRPKDQVPTIYDIYDYDIENIDEDLFGDGDFILSDGNGDIYFFTNGFEYSVPETLNYFSNINANPNYDGMNLSVSAANIYNTPSLPGSEILIGWYDDSLSNIYDDFYDDSSTSLPADIEFWYRTGGMLYDNPTSLTALEQSGQLEELLKTAQSIPSADGIDIDSDGDIDLVVCIDNLYLLWNIGDTVNPLYALDSDYFEDINEVQGKRKYFSPQFVEFDHDNDYDLTIGYSNRVGATYFENYGSIADPRWVEKKELLNNFDEMATINVYNLTRPLFITYQDFSVYDAIQLESATGEDYLDKYLFYTMFNTYTNDFYEFLINYGIQTSYMVATYPIISRVEVNSFKSDIYEEIYTWRNFGFRAIESWSTRLDLYNWTLSVETADIDQDGKGEIIVGDYDNNVYIFEHLTNNTYKIAFRSPDMYQNYPTDQSPYAWDQFGSFTGEFNQTIWNHVSHILVGVDLDRNGYLELVALAGTVLYVFETTHDEFSGRIIDDTYTLLYQYDLLLNIERDYLTSKSYLESTGLTWAYDLDLDGYSEIIVAFESQVFVFIPRLGTIYELYGNVPPSTNSGHYNLPGNSKVFNNITISGVKVFDTNRNGLEEIIIYGDIGQSGWNHLGYLVIIEYNYLGYQIIWELPSSASINNMIYTLEIADQDFDGNWELIIGGEKGIAIWEYDNPDYQQVSVVTGHMNYPYMDSYSMFGESNYYSSDSQIKQRSHDIIQLTYSGANHSYLAVWTEYSVALSQYVLYQSVSHDGETWLSNTMLPRYKIFNMYFPSLVQISDGTIYLIWSQLELQLGLGIYGIFMMNSTNNGQDWSVPYPIHTENGISGNPFRSPTVFSYGTAGIGFGFVFKNTTHSLPQIGFYNKNSGAITTSVEIGSLREDNFYVNGIDVVENPNSPQTYALAMSCHKTTENKDDYDIWFSELNSSLGYSIEPRKLVESAAVEHTPSIAYVYSGNYPLLITYDATGYKQAISTSYGLVSSDYLEWSEPDILSVYPDYIILNSTYDVYPEFKNIFPYGINSHGFRSPKVAATYDGSFVVLTKFDIDGAQIVPYQPLYWEDLLCQVYSLNVTSFTPLEKATDIAVGDTDGDGLQEILVADGYTARLVELFTTQKDYLGFQAKWKSYDYENSVSDVSIYDTNGNGFGELIFSVQGDDVYIFETDNLNVAKVNLTIPILSYTAFDANLDLYELSLSVDIEDDGYPDYVVIMDNGDVYAFIGTDGENRWSTSTSGSSAPVQLLIEGIYEGNLAIFVLFDDGDAFWIDKNEGSILQTFNLEGTDFYDDTGILYDINGDSIDDIIVLTTGLELLTYDGSDGSSLPESQALGTGVRGIDLAYEDSTPSIIVALNNDSVVSYDISLAFQWSFDITTDSNSRVFAEDLNGDSTTEVFITSEPYILIHPNGTWLWNVSIISYSNTAFFYDINKDNVLDIITNGGSSSFTTAYDGSTGEILWNYQTDHIFTGEFTMGTYNGETAIFFAYLDITDLSLGVGSLSPYGTLRWMMRTTYDITENPSNLKPVVIDNTLGVIYGNQGGKVSAVVSDQLIYEIVPENLDVMQLSTIYSSNDDIAEKTVITDDFLGDGNPYLFFVEKGNRAVLYDLKNSLIYSSITLLVFGNVTWAVAADINIDGYPTSVYFITDAFEIGLLSVQDMTLEFLKDESGSIDEFYYMIAYPLKENYDALIISVRHKADYELRTLNKVGDKVWDTIVNTASPYKQLLAGHLLPMATSEDGDFLVLVQDSQLLFHFAYNGTYYHGYDGMAGLVALSNRMSTDSYQSVYFQNYDDIACYDLDLKIIQWTYQVGTEEILDFAFLDYNSDTYIDVYATQNGTGIYLIQDTMAAQTLMWTHIHNSFEARYVEFLKNTDDKPELLIGDYHRLFFATPGAGNIDTATRKNFEQITYLDLWPRDGMSNKTTIIFLAGSTIYSHNLSLIFAGQAEFIEENIIVDLPRLIRLVIPTGIMFITVLIAMVILLKKKE
ncbi:MAG: PQQ-like beta-propeller repeat protein [Asgard group archaeon]|nr:PQQ-like beta-propeller repeat protein [Asgard group archaeon]